MMESSFYHISSSGLIYRVRTLEEAVKSLNEGGFIWLDYYEPEKKEISVLTDILGIHPLSVEDCFDEKQVPKIEHFQNNTFILFNALSYHNKTVFIDEVNLFIGSNFIITISGYDSDGRMPLKNIGALVEHNNMIVKNGPAYLLHTVLDHLVDEKYNAFDIMEDELEEAEERLMDDVSVFQPMRLIHLRRSLVSLRKSLYHEREILVKINRLDCPYIPEKAMAQYRDIYDHLSKFFELTETYRELETSLMELYTSLLNNKMTLASNETNATVKRLTMITTVFLPLTLIASIGGMSEWTMITGGETNWKISYAMLLIFMIIVGGLSYYFIRAIEKGIFSSKKNKRDDIQSVSDMPA